MLEIDDYKDAIRVLSACSVSGVVHSFAEIMARLASDAKSWSLASEHPIAKLYAYKIGMMTGVSPAWPSRSYDTIKAKIVAECGLEDWLKLGF